MQACRNLTFFRRLEAEVGMANLGRMLKQLRGERSRAQKELDRLDEAGAVFEKLVGANPRAALC